MRLDFPLWINVLMYLYNHNGERVTALKMCNEINSTPASISKNLALLRKEKLIEFERKGRINVFLVTTKGKAVASHLSGAISVLNGG